MKENHSSSDTDSLKTHASTKSLSTVSSDLSDILKYPKMKEDTMKKKRGTNTCSTVCLSDSPMVQQLKDKEERKRQLEIEKQRKKDEREKKKAEREASKLLIKEKEKQEKLKKHRTVQKKYQADQLNEDTSHEGDGEGDGDGDNEYSCPVCHITGLSCQWICCDNCDTWLHTHCTEVDPDHLPDIYYCFKCV